MGGPTHPQCTDYEQGALCYDCGKTLCAKLRCGRKQKCPVGCSKEHIPPKAFFTQNKQVRKVVSNPKVTEITVPSCFPCNAQASKSDEYFVRYIVIASLVKSGFAKEVAQKMFRKWLKNKKISKEFAEAAHGYFDIQTPSGIIVGRDHAVTLPKLHLDAFNKCLEKIVRGLYFKYSGKVLSEPLKMVWTNALMGAIFGRLRMNLLSPEAGRILQAAFASKDLEKEQDGMKIIMRYRSLQSDIFRYAFINLIMPDGKEWPLVFLSFYGHSQFIYMLDEQITPPT